MTVKAIQGRYFPPRIERIRVENFRALQSIEMTSLTPLTVLLGPNGSGKSTFFDVFAFLSECLGDGLRRAVASRGDGTLRDLRSRGRDGPISIELKYLEGYFAGDPKPSAITYHLDVDEVEGRPVVAREWMRWKRGSWGAPFLFLDYTAGQGSVITGEVPEAEDARVSRPLSSPDLLAVSTLGQLAENPRIKALREFVTGWRLSHLSAKDMRQIPVAGPQEHLSRTGDNLVNVIDHLQSSHPETLERIFATLRRRIPQIERMEPMALPTGHLLLMMKDRPFSEPMQARYASDGTMKLLAYLVQLHDPAPPPLIGVEEPENFLHPKLLGELAEECEQASARTQLIVATHSPFFINDLEPRKVWAMSRGDNGFTKVRRLSDIPAVPPMIQAGAKLGELWVENYLDSTDP